MASDRILADIVRKNGGKLLDSAIDRLLPASEAAAKKTLLGGIAGAVALRVATRSVPGAIVVGSGLIAKRLYDRRRATAAKPDGDKGKPKPKA